ncbi:MAG: FGGY family carbohydrate kinase [Eisenbergiella sp.]
MKYIMALDQGTTSSRCILFNEKGQMCSVAQKEFTQIYPQPGWVEHDPLEIWNSMTEVMKWAMYQVSATAGEIAGIESRIREKRRSSGRRRRAVRCTMRSSGNAAVPPVS